MNTSFHTDFMPFITVNGNGKCSAVAASLGRPEAEADWLGLRVGGHQAFVPFIC